MIKNIDDLSFEVNAALGALVIHDFCVGYTNASRGGAPYPILFLAIPLCMSSIYDRALLAGNRKTNLLSWLDRFPDIAPGLGQRVLGSAHLTRDAVLAALQLKLVSLGNEGQFVPLEEGLRKKVSRSRRDPIGRAAVKAERLGYWVGKVNAPATVMNLLGTPI